MPNNTFQNRFHYLIERCNIPNCKNGYIIDSTLRPYQQETEKPWVQCECLIKSVLFSKLYAANVPQEYYELSIDQFDIKDADPKAATSKYKAKEEVKNIIKDLRTFNENGSSLLLSGSAGVGKSMLSVEILKQAVAEKYSIYYDFFPIIVEEFKKKGFVADKEKERYAKIFAETDFLVIDEIGKEDAKSDYNSDFSVSRFLEINILKKRNLKNNIFITNMHGLSEIGKKYGEFVNSMMSHRFKQQIEIVSSDYRMK